MEVSESKIKTIKLPLGYVVGFHRRLMMPGHFEWLHPRSYVYYHDWRVIEVENLGYTYYRITFGWRVKILWFHFGRKITQKVGIDE
jgi:hypothetical protein